jgi:hypothetical protein
LTRAQVFSVYQPAPALTQARDGPSGGAPTATAFTLAPARAGRSAGRSRPCCGAVPWPRRRFISGVCQGYRFAVLSVRLAARRWFVPLWSGVLGGRSAGQRRGCGLRRRLLVAAGTVRPGRAVCLPSLGAGGGVRAALSGAVRRRPAVRSACRPGVGCLGAGVVPVVVGRRGGASPGRRAGARRPGFFRAQPSAAEHAVRRRAAPIANEPH